MANRYINQTTVEQIEAALQDLDLRRDKMNDKDYISRRERLIQQKLGATPASKMPDGVKDQLHYDVDGNVRSAAKTSGNESDRLISDWIQRKVSE